jgi:hypothetical protein
MNLPGHDITVEEFNRRCENLRSMKLRQIDMATKEGKKRYIAGVIKRSSDEELIDELTGRGYRVEKIDDKRTV